MSRGLRRIVCCTVARKCWDQGWSLSRIATEAEVSKSTVRRWTKLTGYNAKITEVNDDHQRED